MNSLQQTSIQYQHRILMLCSSVLNESRSDCMLWLLLLQQCCSSCSTFAAVADLFFSAPSFVLSIIPMFIFFSHSPTCPLFPVPLVLVAANQFAALFSRSSPSTLFVCFPRHSFVTSLCLSSEDETFISSASHTCEGGQWIVVLHKSIEYSLGGSPASL